MSIASLPDSFSRRKRLAEGRADPLIYDRLPERLRGQILLTFKNANEAFRKNSNASTNDYGYGAVVEYVREELGQSRLNNSTTISGEFEHWFRSTDELELLLDTIELMCRVIEFMASRSWSDRQDFVRSFVDKINGRLMEASVGYQFEAGNLIQADNLYLHSEAVVPALTLLAAPQYAAANQEFLAAHKAFREADYEQALVESCKAFESVLKVIAAAKGWPVEEGAAVRKLLQAAIQNDLIPSFLENELQGLRMILENGIGTVRNKAGGHGAGEAPRQVDRHLAAFQLHQTAAAIVLLAEAASS